MSRNIWGILKEYHTHKIKIGVKNKANKHGADIDTSDKHQELDEQQTEKVSIQDRIRAY